MTDGWRACEQVATVVNVLCLLLFIGQLACQALAEGVLRSAYLHAVHVLVVVVSVGSYPFPAVYDRVSCLQVSHASSGALGSVRVQVNSYASRRQVGKLLLIHPRLQFITRTFIKCLPMIIQMLFIGFAFMYAFR